MHTYIMVYKGVGEVILQNMFSRNILKCVSGRKVLFIALVSQKIFFYYFSEKIPKCYYPLSKKVLNLVWKMVTLLNTTKITHLINAVLTTSLITISALIT